MNGRAYDYNLGRFLSVDPFIQAPGNSQSMNPYSYIMNNPLSGTDPSGYVSESDGCNDDSLWCSSTGTRAELSAIFSKLGFEVSNGKVNLSRRNGKGLSMAMVVDDTESKFDKYLKKRKRIRALAKLNAGTQRVKRSNIMTSTLQSTSNRGSPLSKIERKYSSSNRNSSKATKLYNPSKHKVNFRLPNQREYAFVQSVAPIFESFGNIEYCAFVCKFIDANGNDSYGLSKIRTDNSHIGCNTSSLSCPVGAIEVADIHNHPEYKYYTANQMDVFFDNSLSVGQSFRPVPGGFSPDDVNVNYSFNLNGWLVPAKTNKLYYYDKTVPIRVHRELTR